MIKKLSFFLKSKLKEVIKFGLQLVRSQLWLRICIRWVRQRFPRATNLIIYRVIKFLDGSSTISMVMSDKTHFVYLHLKAQLDAYKRKEK